VNTNDRIISTTDGRQLHLTEAGQPDGIPVLALHGTPSAGLLYGRWIEDALARGIRLISYDRPGYGGSTPLPGRTVADAAADVAAIAQTLGLERLLVWGLSGGGPHALACAALLPDLVAAVAVLASLAPYPAVGLDWFAGMAEDNVTEFTAALKGREASRQLVEAATPGLLEGDAQSLLQSLRPFLSPTDAAAFTEDYAEFVLNKIRRGIEKRRDGWADDDISFMTPWGFDLAQICRPVLLIHGEQDRAVPFAHGQWLASRIPNAEVRFSANDGHATLSLRRIPEVHVWLLSQWNAR